MAGIFGPIGFLFYNAILTYKSILKAQKLLQELGIQEQAKGRYVKMAKKLGFFFITTIMCYLAAVTATMYEWTTGQYFPAGGSIAAAISAIMLSSVINPSLFFYLNVDLREKFWEKFGAPVYRLLGIKTMEPMKISLHSMSKGLSSMRILHKRSTIAPSLSHANSNFSSIRSDTMSDAAISSFSIAPNADFVYWLSNDKLAQVIKEHARKEYVMENFLFYEDAMTYRSKGSAIVKAVTKLRSTEIENDKAAQAVYSDTNVQQDWRELESLANRIYTLYIKV
jgi:hypothetical protein